MARAGDAASAARLKIQGPSGKMNSLDLASLCCEPQCLGCDPEKARGLAKVQPRLDPIIGGLVDGNTVMRAQRGDALTRPAVTVARDQCVPVQDAGDEIIICNQHEL